LAALVLVLVAVAMLVPAGGAASAETATLVTGETVVVGAGQVGATVRVPEGTTLGASDIRVELTDATYGYLAIGNRACAAIGGHLCIQYEVRAFPDFPPLGAPIISAPEDGEIPAGLHDLYLLTDGTMRVRLQFRNLAADPVEIVPTRPVAAIVERLARRCPGLVDEDCDHFAYGGTTHELSPPALATVIAYSHMGEERITGDIPPPGTGNVSTCLYPWHGTDGPASTDPDDHPRGCALLPGDKGESTVEGPERLALFAFNALPGLGHGFAEARTNHHPNGPVYAGYVGQAYSPFPGAGFNAWGIWLDGWADEAQPS
jgi:hypothetical protein